MTSILSPLTKYTVKSRLSLRYEGQTLMGETKKLVV